ncbi:hypothetical protein FQN54_001932 [Arachnomyces sp. PD_36]|nr:hypothetical protein FQN54_001932 [Arachnomyces sp. PD_36]
MAGPGNQNDNGGKTRRRHLKSRNGCFECKRRRVKCDEMKPSCLRCVLSLDKCFYPSPQRPATKAQNDKLPVPSSSSNRLSPSLSIPSYAERSPSFGPSTRSPPDFVHTNRYPDGTDASDGLSDTDLYHHYLQHTSRTLTHSRRDRNALQIGMPTLALQSKTVFHSILAASAACLACDMISKKPPAEVSAVHRVLITGYRHYNLASERMRESISSPSITKLEPLLASALMLVPFAASSQQINHWISERTEVQERYKLLSSTPRDIIVIMRGIKTTLQTLDCGGMNPNPESSPDMGFASDSSSTSPEANAKSAAPTSSRAHVMLPIISSTSSEAFSTLQKRLETALLHCDGPGDSLAACHAAFEVLKSIRSNAFSASNSSPSSTSANDHAEETFEPEPVPQPQVASWLRSIASRSVIPLPTEPLTRFFLTFLVQVPQAYLDLVLPLLDQRLESPIGATPDEIAAELTTEQALALDIYAHWSILMFLAEEESWWIGNLPTVTLTGMVNRYGDKFGTRLWPDSEPEESWWPGSMLNILREIKRYR